MPFAPTSWVSGQSPFALDVVVAETITGDPGSYADVTDISLNPNVVALQFEIPRGNDGDPGPPGADAQDPVFSTEVASHSPTATPSVTLSGTYPNKLMSFVLRDGEPGPPGASANVFPYTFETATSAPPTTGHVRVNDSVPGSVSSVYVSHVNKDGNDVKILLLTIATGSTITIQHDDDAAIRQRYTVTGITDNSTYTTVSVTPLDSAGTLANNQSSLIILQLAGTPGPAGSVGPTPVISIGTVTSADYPTASATMDVTDPAAPILSLVVPRGPAGIGSGVTISNSSSPGTFRLLFTNTATGGTATTLNTMATGLNIIPATGAITSTGSITAASFSGPLTGNASSATQVTTTRSAATALQYITFSDTDNPTAAASNLRTATAITYTPGETGGATLRVPKVTCTGAITAPNFTGLASNSSQVITNNSASTAVRYLCITPSNNTVSGAASDIQTATAISCIPQTGALTVSSLTATTVTATLVGNASSATEVATTNTTATTTRYFCFVPNSSGTTVGDLETTTAIRCVPSTGAITATSLNATTVTAALVGNASSATQVSTTRTISSVNRYVLLSPNDNATAAAADVQTATALTFNPNSGLLTTPSLTVTGTFTGTVSTCTNIAGGAGGSLPYQTGAGATTFLPISTVAGAQLRSTSTVPTWATPGGFPVYWGGNASAAGMVLQYGLPSALFATTTLNTTLGLSANGFTTPYAGIIVAAAAYSTTSTSSATATIHVNGSATATVTIPAGQFTSTGNRVVSLSSTTTTFPAGALIDVRINTAAIGNCGIFLYIA